MKNFVNDTLQKAEMASTVREFMTDDVVINALNAAYAYGRGELQESEITPIFCAAYEFAYSIQYKPSIFNSEQERISDYRRCLAAYAAAAAVHPNKSVKNVATLVDATLSLSQMKEIPEGYGR